MSLNLFSLSLRTKLLSIVFLILLIPVVLIGLLKQVEQIMLSNLKNNLLFSSNLISLQLSLNSDWFDEIQLPTNDEFVAKELFVFPLEQRINPDGFFNEWQQNEPFRQSFYSDPATNSSQNKIGLLLASYDDSLYLSLKVIDDNVIYAKNNAGYSSDTLVISFLDNQNRPRRIFISPAQQGKVSVKKYLENKIQVDYLYHAYWAETDAGFNFEMKFPAGLKPKELRVTHFDVEKPKLGSHKNRVSTSGIELNPLVWPSESIDQFIKKIEMKNGQRLLVLDRQGRVIARKGSLIDINSEAKGIVNQIANWVLSSNSSKLSDQRGTSLVLNSTVVFDALKGKAASMIESTGAGKHSIVLVSTPIKSSGQVIGAIFIEENIASNQLLQRKTLAKMIGFVLLIIALIFILVIWYISRVSSRIIQLKVQINRVVDDEGRINTPLEIKQFDGDEIDDLSNAFAHMGAKLYEYNDYLEKLASRLSHELRTPIAIVRSSLDNLLINTDDLSSKETIQRALAGTQRLGEIISRMRQASGVKNAMQTAQFESIDFCLMLTQLVNGFCLSFPKYQFRFETEQKVIKHLVSTDLMAELLDKLLSNAMDFCNKNSVIIIGLNKTEKRLILSVTNQGKTILKNDQRKIFQSLVSIRANEASEIPNLGLGLYVVKLIANFHSARVKVENLNDNSGVKFSVIWKL